MSRHQPADEDFRLASYDYALPPDALVAQEPLAERDASRLLVLDRATGRVDHRRFADLPDLLRPGDLLVTNRSRVFPARLLGRRPGGGPAEILLVRERGGGLWDAMLRPGRRLRAGMVVEMAPDFRAVIEAAPPRSEARAPEPAAAARPAGAEQLVRGVRLLSDAVPSARRSTASAGSRSLRTWTVTRNRSTGNATKPCTPGKRDPSPRRPPACTSRGAHRPLARRQRSGSQRRRCTSDPAPSGRVTGRRRGDHRCDPRASRSRPRSPGGGGDPPRRGRVMAVGTTIVRTLETAAGPDREGAPGGAARPCHLAGVPLPGGGRLVTNFHLPQSSLLVLVAAFAGHRALWTPTATRCGNGIASTVRGRDG